MSNKDLLNNIKKLRELTGVGFKDCKVALDETSGDIEKSIEFLRKKGIAKASKKMSRTATEGLVLVTEKDNKVSIIEINSETDFVAKNKDFIAFCKELSEINFSISELVILHPHFPSRIVPIIKGEVMYSFIEVFGFFIIYFILLEGNLLKIRFSFYKEYKSSVNHISLKLII